MEAEIWMDWVIVGAAIGGIIVASIMFRRAGYGFWP